MWEKQKGRRDQAAVYIHTCSSAMKLQANHLGTIFLDNDMENKLAITFNWLASLSLRQYGVACYLTGRAMLVVKGCLA